MERENILANAISKIEFVLGNPCSIQEKRGSAKERLFEALSDIVKDAEGLLASTEKLHQLESDKEGIELALHCIKMDIQVEQEKLEKLQQKFS